MVSVMITSNSDDSQYDNGKPSRVTVYAATVRLCTQRPCDCECDCVLSGSVTESVYAVTMWLCGCDGVQSHSVTVTVYTVAVCQSGCDIGCVHSDSVYTATVSQSDRDCDCVQSQCDSVKVGVYTMTV